MSRSLPLIGAALIFWGVFLLFLSSGAAFWFFIIGGGLIFIHYKMPQGKEELIIAQAAEQASIARKEELIARREELKKRFQQFSDNPSDTASLEYVLNALAGQDKKSLKKWMKPIVIPLLKLKPLDSAIREMAFGYARNIIKTSIVGQQEASSKEVYEAALEILSQHPEQIPLKQYVLEVGRWHFGIQRPNGRITIYDEQAIQNDIVVRSK